MTENTRIQQTLLGYALFSGLVASVGIPLYVHLPAFLAERYGIALDTLGVLLLVLRFVDFIQDPLLGWSLSRYSQHRSRIAAVSIGTLAFGVVGLFGISAPFMPLVWVTFFLILTFTSFSLLSIVIYSEGVKHGSEVGHVVVGLWREAATLIAITLACLLPFVLPGDGYRGFALAFAGTAVWIIPIATKKLHPVRFRPTSFRAVLGNSTTRKFLALIFLNSTPVAVTSTLFVFFVEYRLELESLTGVFLILFFLAAAISTPVWRAIALRRGYVQSLMFGMTLSISGFVWAYFLGPGDGIAFTIVCLVTGFGLGADLLLLPALFSEHQSRSDIDSSMAFGFWNFAGKATLAVSAGVVLPILEWSGFDVSSQMPSSALTTLSILYAAVPCLLKLAAMLFLLLVMAPRLVPASSVAMSQGDGSD